MRYIKYGQWNVDDWDDLSLEELMNQLSDYLLQSGFQRQFRERAGGMDPEEALQELREAIADALLSSNLLDEEQFQQLFDEDGNPKLDKLENLIERLIARLLEAGYLSIQGENGEVEWYMDDENGTKRIKFRSGQGETSEYDRPSEVRFEVTQKGADFLGYNALRNLLGSIGHSSFGRHDTELLSTGIEAFQAAKPYEFGDAMNLDASETLRAAIQRNGLEDGLQIGYEDLRVNQSEYQSSCATVLMLDCSHSMILYGEDRFTPAKRVCLALSHLIRTQYPGDTLRVVLFHDDAEEIPLGKLAAVQVGPFHTNTCEGLKLARRILLSQRCDMRQIIMITDGKPSAIFVEEEGKRREADRRRLYKNSFGLDPLIIQSTLAQAAECRRSGIMVNTFMLTDDFYLVEFVRQLTEIAQGKAYFTTSLQLGEYVMMDFVKRKTSLVR